jgi:glycosyltransferase involved in cell wall biosynthesis
MRADRFGDESLLVLAHDYTTFTKIPVELLAAQFDTVTVLVRYNPFAEVSEYLPIQRLRPYRRTAKIDRRDLPANVTVETTSLRYLPTTGGYERLGARHARAVEKQVDRIEQEFDLIHAHFTWTAGYAAAVLKRTTDLPMVLTVHADRERFLKEYGSGFESVYDTWRAADAIIRVNRRDVPLLERYNDVVHTIPNGFSRDRYRLLDQSEARAHLGIDTDVELVFSLGALKRRKGQRYLLDSTRRIVDRREDVLCAIGGQGRTRRRLERQARALGIEDHVEILGFVPESEVDLWMNACDVFCLPSLSEGNPTVMFEALGCGKPYVGTDVGGVSEIVTSAEYGLLCEPADSAALADRLLAAFDTDWNKGRIHEYAQRYTWETVVREIEDVYAATLDDEGLGESLPA